MRSVLLALGLIVWSSLGQAQSNPWAPQPNTPPVTPPPVTPPPVTPPPVTPPPITPPPVAPVTVPVATPVGDVVELVDGTILTGTVSQQEPGKFVTIRLADGSQQTLNWADVKRVRMGPAQVAPTAVPATAPQPAALTVRTASGESLAFTLAPPPTYAINFALGGFASYAGPQGVTLPGGGADISGQGIIGLTKFPDTHGGDWHGVRVDAFLQIHGGGILVSGDSNDDGGYVALNGGVGVGYTYLHMRDIDLDYFQRGIGFAATWRFGDQQVWPIGSKGAGDSSSGFAHGPSLQLIFPKYAAHRGSLDYSWINFNIVLWQDTTFYQLGGGGTF